MEVSNAFRLIRPLGRLEGNDNLFARGSYVSNAFRLIRPLGRLHVRNQGSLAGLMGLQCLSANSSSRTEVQC